MFVNYWIGTRFFWLAVARRLKHRCAGVFTLFATCWLIACGQPAAPAAAVADVRARQCETVVGFWAAAHKNSEVTLAVVQNPAGLVHRYTVSMTMLSALGELPGVGFCDYPQRADGSVAMEPQRIALGNIVHQGRQNIADLLAMKVEFDTGDHDH